MVKIKKLKIKSFKKFQPLISLDNISLSFGKRKILNSAFFIALTTLAKNSKLLIKNININPSRIGVVTILKKMGAQIALKNQRNYRGEKISDILIKISKKLKATDYPTELSSGAMGKIRKLNVKSFKKSQPLISLEKPLISLENISLSFGKRKILDNVSFNIGHAEVMGMLGPNGVGKSTIFNLITGLIKPDYGKIKFNGVNVVDYPIYLRTKKFKIGYVPQYGGYFSDLTLLENLRAIAEIIIEDKNLIYYKIDELISKFELDAVRDVEAKFLSGGQKKKLVIALALLGDPKVLLLDECFAALDVLTIKMLQEVIVNLQSENNITICICDHQARDLLSCVDVAIILSNCKIVAHRSPNELVKNTEAKNAYFGDSFKFN